MLNEFVVDPDALEVAGVVTPAAMPEDNELAPAYKAALQQVAGLVPAADPGAVTAAVGNTVAAVEAVPAAGRVPGSPGPPADAIRFAILLGGDADMIATMTGALADARCGASALPPPWLQRLECAGPPGPARPPLVRTPLAARRPGTGVTFDALLFPLACQRPGGQGTPGPLNGSPQAEPTDDRTKSQMSG